MIESQDIDRFSTVWWFQLNLITWNFWNFDSTLNKIDCTEWENYFLIRQKTATTTLVITKCNKKLLESAWDIRKCVRYKMESKNKERNALFANEISLLYLMTSIDCTKKITMCRVVWGYIYTLKIKTYVKSNI